MRVTHEQESEACCSHFIVKAFAFVVLIPGGRQHLARVNLLTSESPLEPSILGLRFEFLPRYPGHVGIRPIAPAASPLRSLWHSLRSVPTPTVSSSRHRSRAGVTDSHCSPAPLPNSLPGTYFQQPAILS